MSISFSAPDLQPTYEAVRDGSADYDWAIFHQAGNELKVQATGSGLDDLEEEFMDGRIQYAFARVKDPNVSALQQEERELTARQSSLDKFVQVSWCGDGVPESKKGFFRTHQHLSRGQA